MGFLKQLFFFSIIAISLYAIEEQSTQEQDEITQRLANFYRMPSQASVMDTSTPKYDAMTGDLVIPNPRLQLESTPLNDPLLQQAQAKANPKYQVERCKKLLGQKFAL